MRVLVTGATGLIGKEIGKLLVESGHELVVVSRNPAKARLDLPFPAEIFAWQGESEQFPKAALQGVEGVIHLAGESVASGRWTPERKKSIRDSRVMGTRRLVEAISQLGNSDHPLKTFISGSAIGIYGDRGDEILTEDSAPGGDFLSHVTRDWEGEADALTRNSKTKHIRVAKIRTSVVISRHGGALEKMLPVFSRGLGGKLGSGQQWMSWIHLEDIARLFVFALETENVSGALNGAAPEPARNERFTVALARALGRSVFLPVPDAALKVALGEMSEAVLGSQRVSAAYVQELGFQFRHPELVPALEEICAPLKQSQHELLAEQWVPKTPHEIFPYFCSEKNLEELTPPFLNFKVIGKSTPEIKEGTLIDYRLGLYGMGVKWRTLIETWKPSGSFVDIQLKGPYRRWHHTHEFIPMGGGTLLRDRVVYQLPLGIFGDLAAGWKVTGDVNAIFAYRRKKINELFGSLPAPSAEGHHA